jgi:hypothetical protein
MSDGFDITLVPDIRVVIVDPPCLRTDTHTCERIELIERTFEG